MARMSKEEKALNKAFYESYNRLGSGVQVDIMDMGKMYDEALVAAKAGVPMNEAVADVIGKYRKN